MSTELTLTSRGHDLRFGRITARGRPSRKTRTHLRSSVGPSHWGHEDGAPKSFTTEVTPAIQSPEKVHLARRVSSGGGEWRRDVPSYVSTGDPPAAVGPSISRDAAHEHDPRQKPCGEFCSLKSSQHMRGADESSSSSASFTHGCWQGCETCTNLAPSLCPSCAWQPPHTAGKRVCAAPWLLREEMLARWVQ